MKKRISNVLFCVSTYILLWILMTNIVTVAGWLFHFGINRFTLILGLILSSILNYFVHKKLSQITTKDYIVSTIILIIGFLIALLIANTFYDISYDGSWYHLTSIIRMSEGWNPIFESIESGYYGDVYIDSYACKSIWSFSATVIKLIGNINSSNVISTLYALSAACLASSIFLKKSQNIFQGICSLILGMLIGFNPIYISQMFTNYIDSSLGLLIIIYVLLFIKLYLKENNFNEWSFSLLISSVIALMANTKLTGLYFAAVFFFFFVGIHIIYLLVIKELKIKYFLKIFISGFFGLCLTAFIGINPYITNVQRGHNMFYPILGEERIEVMGANIPESFRGKTNFEKLILANFSETSANAEIENTKQKKPLLIQNDYKNIVQDSRVNAFGPYFAIMLLFALFITLFYFKNLFKNNDKYKLTLLLTEIIILINAIIFDESWWGRYYVILWLIPILIYSYCVMSKRKLQNIFGIMGIVLGIINSALVFFGIYNYNENNSRPIYDYIDTLENKEIIFNANDDTNHLFDYVFLKYFDEKNIKATSVPNSNINWDFESSRINIKIIDDLEEKKLFLTQTEEPKKK